MWTVHMYNLYTFVFCTYSIYPTHPHPTCVLFQSVYTCTVYTCTVLLFNLSSHTTKGAATTPLPKSPLSISLYFSFSFLSLFHSFFRYFSLSLSLSLSLAVYLFLFLSPSLSLTHTHTHNHQLVLVSSRAVIKYPFTLSLLALPLTHTHTHNRWPKWVLVCIVQSDLDITLLWDIPLIDAPMSDTRHCYDGSRHILGTLYFGKEKQIPLKLECDNIMSWNAQWYTCLRVFPCDFANVCTKKTISHIYTYIVNMRRNEWFSTLTHSWHLSKSIDFPHIHVYMCWYMYIFSTYSGIHVLIYIYIYMYMRNTLRYWLSESPQFHVCKYIKHIYIDWKEKH